MNSLIIITYRHRRTHLDCLLRQLNRCFSHIPVLVVEQCDNEKWNKGLLYNAAYQQIGYKYDYLILHDVDFIPDRTVNYRPTELPSLLSTQCSQFNYGQCYPTFFGGVVGIPKQYYEQVNGFSNLFRGWGGEDDNFYKRLQYHNIHVSKVDNNRFENFIHPRLDVLGKDRNNPDYLNNLKLCTTDIDYATGLSDAQYSVISNREHKECKHLRISTI